MKTNIKDILAAKTKQALSSNILQADTIRKNIIILDELRSLIPPLLEDEFKQLESNIIEYGCQSPLQLWQANKKVLNLPYSKDDELAYVLIDGHNRFKICTTHHLPFEIYQLSFDSLKDAKDYMINLQLGRRNLSPTQIAYFRGLRYNNEKSDKTENLSKGHFVPSEENTKKIANNSPKGHFVPSGISTAERLAEEYKVNAKTIKRDAEFAKGLEKLSSDLRNKILTGAEKIEKGLIQELGKNTNITSQISTVQEIQNLTKTISLSIDNPIQQQVELINNILKKFSKTQQKSDLEDLIKAAKDILKTLK
ncbi:hypothetical protein [Emticicia sp. SJ17W-69]|uniref:hypothetical protein n=1 Tax=Emticicia sp. SJ17W-69 TaxID=3421657 RepID=UPI003EBF1DE7